MNQHDRVDSGLRIQQQGRCIVDKADGGYLVMLPNGEVYYRARRDAVVRVCRSWYRRNLEPGLTIGVGRIEWRDRRS